jgi:hypothetical protein
LFIQQNWFPDQKDVVCKVGAPGFGTEQVLLLQILGQGLSCCLQETQLLPRPAKLLLRNALDPELRCCLQDCADAVSDHGTSAAADSGQPLRDVPCGNASSNPNCGLAIFGGCRDKHRGTRDRRQSSVGGIRFDAFSGMPFRRRPPGEVETSKAERASGNSGSAVPSYCRCRIPAWGDRRRCPPPSRFRNCCRVHTASPPMSSLRTTTKPGKLRVF